MSPSPEKFPPRVIELFEKAQGGVAGRDAGRRRPPRPRAAEPKKKGGAARRCSSWAAWPRWAAARPWRGRRRGAAAQRPAATHPRQPTTRTDSGSVADQEPGPFSFTATRAGTAEVTIAWQDRNVQLVHLLLLPDPPFRECPGTYNQTQRHDRPLHDHRRPGQLRRARGQFLGPPRVGAFHDHPALSVTARR